MKLRIKKANKIDVYFGRLLGLLLFKTSLMEFLHLFLGTSVISTYIVYAIIFVYVIHGVFSFHVITGRKILTLLTIYAIFGLIYVFSPSDQRSYYFQLEMLLTYFCYLPIAILFVDMLSQPKAIMQELTKFSAPAILISAYMIFVRNYAASGQDSYMAFSYAVLPFVLLSFYKVKDHKIFFLFYIVGLIEIVIYGARFPLLIAVVCPVIMYLIENTTNVSTFKKAITIVLLALFCIAIVVFEDDILKILDRIGVHTGSYALSGIARGRFWSSSTRMLIYENAINLIKGSHGSPLGLFADRTYLNVVYVHNVFLELIINFGVIVGFGLSLLIIFCVIVSFVRGRDVDNRILLLFAFCSMFMRLFVSGSYLTEGISFVYFALIFSFSFRKRKVIEMNDVRMA